MTYEQWRDHHIGALAKGHEVKWPGPVINNTENSRQVRRQRAREAEKEPKLSQRLTMALEYLDEGQGLFMQLVITGGGNHRYRRYIRGYASESRTPSEDYTPRYQALFNLPQDQAASA